MALMDKTAKTAVHENTKILTAVLILLIVSFSLGFYVGGATHTHIHTPTQMNQNVNIGDLDGKDKINLNTCSIKQLESIPLIGPETAKHIVAYREKQKFSNINELLDIPGIGTDKFKILIKEVKIE